MQSQRPFHLFLFHRTLKQSQIFAQAGIDGLIVDLENHGKGARQIGFDTEINTHQVSDVYAVKSHSNAHVLCRVNGPSPDMKREIHDVLDAGADEIIVPMIRKLDQAQEALDCIAGRAKVTLMVETAEAVSLVPQLCDLPIDRIYVGLNDLRISRGVNTIFTSLTDGVMDNIRRDVSGVAFGFGGLTLRGKGSPLPVRHLVADLARHDADFTFLRRSFYNDIANRDPALVLQQIKQDVHAAKCRKTEQVYADFDAMKSAIQTIEAAADG